MVQYFLYHLLNLNGFAVLSLPLGLTRSLSNLPELLWIGICRSRDRSCKDRNAVGPLSYGSGSFVPETVADEVKC